MTFEEDFLESDSLNRLLDNQPDKKLKPMRLNKAFSWLE